MFTTDCIEIFEPMAKPTRPEPEHYVDNELFYQEMCKYRDEISFWKNTGKKTPKPQVSEYIGDCIMRIATRFSHRSNFVNYPFREDMIADAVLNAIQYIDNFDPQKSKNPFSYFSQIVYYAFIRKIEAEKDELAKKFRLQEDAMINDEMACANPNKYGSDYSINNRNEYLENFERSRKAKKRGRRRSTASPIIFEET